MIRGYALEVDCGALVKSHRAYASWLSALKKRAAASGRGVMSVRVRDYEYGSAYRVAIVYKNSVPPLYYAAFLFWGMFLWRSWSEFDSTGTVGYVSAALFWVGVLVWVTQWFWGSGFHSMVAKYSLRKAGFTGTVKRVGASEFLWDYQNF